MKLEKNVMHLDIREYFFSQRVIDYWNALPQTAIDAKSINNFKSQLKIHLNNIIRGFLFFLLVSSGCLTGSWSVWSHAVTPHSTIYHLVFVI